MYKMANMQVLVLKAYVNKSQPITICLCIFNTVLHFVKCTFRCIVSIQVFKNAMWTCKIKILFCWVKVYMLTKMDRALRLKKIKSTLLKTEFLSLSITDVKNL